MSNFPSKDRRMVLCATPVTLDGKPAKISGYNNPFATVSLASNGLSCEFAWETVDHIVSNRKGRFSS